MKTKNLLSSTLLVVFLFPITLIGQSKWSENDDMYFSKKDRAKIYASVTASNEAITHDGESDYAANHNFNSPTVQNTTVGSPTVQTNGDAEADNNQYFIKDYSLPKDKTYESAPINTYGNIPPSFNNRPNVNVIMSYGMGYGFGSRRFGYNSLNRFYNPYTDPFSPYYDPFLSYNDPWNNNSFGYDPWRYNRFGSWGSNNRFGINRYYNSANWCPTNGYTNYSSNVRNEVRYRNGRKVISGSRSSRSGTRANTNFTSSDRAIKNVGAAVKPNGRSSSRASRSSYRKYPNSTQNRVSDNSRAKTKRVNTYNRSSTTNRSNLNNNSNHNRSNSYRSSGYSSGSRSSSSFSRPSSGGSRSSGSRPSSGSSRSGGKRGN